MPALRSTTSSPHTYESRGPYFDELSVGQVFASGPPVTLTDGLAAAHQAIVGNRALLSLSSTLSQAVTGRTSIAYPALVWDVAIGQSTVATHHVRANLFYRGLTFRHFPSLGETLTTRTTVEGLRENSRREGRSPTGLAALRVTTINQDDDVVLDFWRCAMLPLSSAAVSTGFTDDLGLIGVGAQSASAANLIDHWDLRPLSEHGAPTPLLAAGDTIRVVGADVVSSAPELARLSGNVAAIHHDSQAAGGSRLVYGGHTIDLALLQVNRALPQLVTVLGWTGCDHVAPVREGDSLSSTITVEDVAPVEHGAVVSLRVLVDARRPDAETGNVVLDWQLTALTAISQRV